MAQVKRETASICRVNDLLSGHYVKTEGWAPSYFETGLGTISRASLMGVVVSKDQSGVLLDDGTGRIILRAFEEGPLSRVEIGDFILVIGRPRIYNEQKYVLPEIIKKIDAAWAEFRRAQMELLVPVEVVHKPEPKKAAPEPVEQVSNPYSKIVEFIRDLDAGEGADSQEVAKRSGFANADELILRLLEEGEIFEFRPGKLKILE
jgi:hypothetical protein